MSRAVPMGPCVALLRAFDKDNASPQQTIVAAAALVESELGDALDDLNDGQFAALIDFMAWKGLDIFAESDILEWLLGGNQALPAKELPTYGPRGLAERDVWNRGADL